LIGSLNPCSHHRGRRQCWSGYIQCSLTREPIGPQDVDRGVRGQREPLESLQGQPGGGWLLLLLLTSPSPSAPRIPLPRGPQGPPRNLAGTLALVRPHEAPAVGKALRNGVGLGGRRGTGRLRLGGRGVQATLDISEQQLPPERGAPSRAVKSGQGVPAIRGKITYCRYGHDEVVLRPLQPGMRHYTNIIYTNLSKKSYMVFEEKVPPPVSIIIATPECEWKKH